MAPPMSLPMTRSSSTSRSVNSRRSTVCTLSTPTRPPGSVSIGTETIDVKSDPRSDSNGLALSGHPPRDALAQRQPDLADLAVERGRGAGQGERALGVVEHVHETDVGTGGRGDHPGCRRGEWLHAGPAGRGLDQFPQQGQLTVGVDEVAYDVGACHG